MTGHYASLRCDCDRKRPSRAVLDRAAHCGRHERRLHRARAFWRNLRQRRMHSDQDPRGERADGPCRAPRRRLWSSDRGPGRGRHEGGEGAQGHGLGTLAQRGRELAARHGALHDLLGFCPLHRGETGIGQRRNARRRADLHQRRRAPKRAADSRARSGTLPDKCLDDDGRFSSRPPGDPRRQLCGPRVRADVPAFR